MLNDPLINIEADIHSIHINMSLKEHSEHITFVESLVSSPHLSEQERINVKSYLRAVRDGLLENHRGRFIYIRKGRMLNKSFKRAHDVFDHVLPPDSHEKADPVCADATFIYVPSRNIEV